LQQDFDGAAFVHGAVGLSDLAERERQVEHLARVDPAVQDPGDQVGQERLAWGGAAAEPGVGAEQFLAVIERTSPGA
jgi:hypothetical protein